MTVKSKHPLIQRAQEILGLIKDLSSPLPGLEPTGVSIRGEPIFDQISLARQEENENLPQGIWKISRKRADWVLVDKLCQEVLTTRSKDLQIAAWFLEARFHIAGIAGLIEGLTLIRDLCARYWDNLYPKLEENGNYDFRLTPIEWLNHKFSDTLLRVRVTAPIDISKPRYSMANFIHAKHLAHLSLQQKYAKTLLEQAKNDGEITLESFSQNKLSTPLSFYETLILEVDQAFNIITEIDKVLNQKTHQSTAFLYNLRDTLLSIKRLAETAIEEIRARTIEKSAASPPLLLDTSQENSIDLQKNLDQSPVEPLQETQSTSKNFTTEPLKNDISPPLTITSRLEAYKFLEQILNYLKQTETA